MPDVATMIGPADAGRRMRLDEFATVEGEPGHLYELAKGVIVLVDVPHFGHGRIVDAISDQLRAYKIGHSEVFHYLAAGSDACLQLPGMQSERHPDLSVYLTPPPDTESPWDQWIPSIVVEVVSESSVDRDYREKRDEFLAAGVTEYWIVDPLERRMLVLRRRGDVWAEQPVQPGESFASRLLPGFRLETETILPVKS